MLFWKEKQNFIIILACISCSKSIIKMLQQGLKYVQSSHKRQQNDVIGVVMEPYLLTLNISHLVLLFRLITLSINAGRNCKNVLYGCHQIKLQQQVKL